MFAVLFLWCGFLFVLQILVYLVLLYLPFDHFELFTFRGWHNLADWLKLHQIGRSVLNYKSVTGVGVKMIYPQKVLFACQMYGAVGVADRELQHGRKKRVSSSEAQHYHHARRKEDKHKWKCWKADASSHFILHCFLNLFLCAGYKEQI